LIDVKKHFVHERHEKHEKIAVISQ